MRRILLYTVAAVFGFSLTGAAPILAQTHKVAKPEDVVRAVGVYEWIGDETKPNASRLIPITLFVDGELQDAGVYLARPIPLAIDSGTVYEVDKAGVSEGTVDLKYASHLQAADAAANYDDGWFAYGIFTPPPAPKKLVALKESKTPSKIESSRADQESDRPTFTRKHDSPATAPTNSPADTKTDTKPTTGTTAPAPPDDPDRPHMTKKSDSSSSGSQTPGSDQSSPANTGTDKTATTANPSPAPANDPDRPTLKKRTPEEAKKARKEAEQSSAAGLATSLNDDPNRPTLHRGKGVQALTENDLPKLKGVPIGLKQAVAVSDAKTRPPHDFSRPWTDDTERASILAKMQTLARAQVAAYQKQNTTAAPSPAKRPPNSKLRRGKTADGSAPSTVPLMEEQLNGYTLSYGGAATYVYTAHTPGEAAALRYVTVVAQVDAFGELQPAIQSVTDAAHLDRAAWMRLIDVVDVDASNRASLLFEMRGQSARQFALYRVIAARAEQTFLTGTTQ